jgi:hypothetical protein
MNNNLHNIFKRLTSFLPYVFVFIASLYQPKDPDLGWHLKYGEYFFKHHQLLRDNIFSTMMPNYHWANGSWGTDLITYFIFHSAGFLGLALVAAFVVMLTFYFFSKAAKFTFFENAIFFPIIIFLESSMNSNSFRGQQLTLLFLGMLFFILSRYKPLSKKMFFIPILFLVWGNIHEENVLGFVLFGLWFVFIIIRNFLSYYQKDKTTFFQETLLLGLILFLTFIAILINPFGISIPLFALSHFGNPLLQNVNEYIPFTLYSVPWFSLIFMTMLIILGIIHTFFKKNIINTLPIWCIPLILIIFSFFVRRYVWPGYYLTLPFFGIIALNFKKYLKIFDLSLGIIISLVAIFGIFYIKMPFAQFSNMSWKTYCQIQGSPCSSKSAEYLISHHLTQNLYSYYDWGGWLIWNYPKIKPSIDGRMIAWQDNKGYSAAADYYAYENNQKDINNSKYNIAYLPLDRSPVYFELSNLISQNKWKLAYQDDNAMIVIRVKK